MKRLLVLAVILGFTVFGCAEKKTMTTLDQQQETQTPQTKKFDVEEPKKAPEKITEQQVAKVESKDLPSREEEISGMFKNIHFDYDKYDIRDDAKPILKSIAEHLSKNTSQKVLIEGHCDDRGTNEYNLALGDRRAKAVKDYLLSLAVPSLRIETISYGEEKPLCKEQTEDCWAKNRRAQFVVLKGKK